MRANGAVPREPAGARLARGDAADLGGRRVKGHAIIEAMLLLVALPVLFFLWLATEPAVAAAIGVSLDGPAVDFGAVSPRDGARVAQRAVQLAVQSDVPWHVTVAATGDFRSGADGAMAVPVARLAWRLEGDDGGTWRAVDTVPAIVAEGPGGEGPVLLPLSFRLEVTWDDPPGAAPYSTQLVYTASPGAALTASVAQALPGSAEEPMRCAIGYWVPGEGTVPVRIQVAGPSGSPVRTVLLDHTGGQWHTWVWDGFDEEGRPLPPAGYYYTIFGPESHLLAAGACLPEEEAVGVSPAVVVRVVRDGSDTTVDGRLALAAATEPQQVRGGDWLRLEWTVRNPGTQPVASVRLELDLPGWLRPQAGVERVPLALTPSGRPGYERWALEVGDLPAGGAQSGHVWMAVAPFAPPGVHRLGVTARDPAGQILAEPIEVTVTVVPGHFAAGRLVVQVMPVEAASGVVFRIAGGPRFSVDAQGLITWSAPPGLYVLVPEEDTLPAGWTAPAVPVRLAPGSLTYLAIPLRPSADAATAPHGASAEERGALAVEAEPNGVRLAAAWGTGDSRLELNLDPLRARLDQGTVENAVLRVMLADVLLPLGWPWSEDMALYMSGRRKLGERNHVEAAVMAGPAAFVGADTATTGDLHRAPATEKAMRSYTVPEEAAPLWGLHVLRQEEARALGALWILGTDGDRREEMLGIHGQAQRGLVRIAAQALWRLTLPPSVGGAWGVSAAAPLSGLGYVEAAYRWAAPQFYVPWRKQQAIGGWSMSLRLQPQPGTEWQSSVQVSNAHGPQLDVAGRVGAWEVRQRLVHDGEWRPATSLTLPVGDAWVTVRADGQGPALWSLGGQAGAWTWQVSTGGAEPWEVGLAWQGTGPGHTRVHAGAALRDGAGNLTQRVDAHLALSGFLGVAQWSVELHWQPSDHDSNAGAALGWRMNPAGGQWQEAEIRWQRGRVGETWEARLAHRRSLGPGKDVTGQLLLRRASRDGAGGLNSGQVSWQWTRPIADGWRSLTELGWSVQSPDSGGFVQAGGELGWGVARDMDAGWRWAAGWRWSTGSGAGGGPFVRVEHVLGAVSGN